MARKIEISEVHQPRELVNWIKQELSPKWTISVGENTDANFCPNRGAFNDYFWAASASTFEPLYLRVFFYEKTFAKLVRTVSAELVNKVLEELRKKAAEGQVIPSDVIEANHTALGRQTLAIERKPLALTHRP